MKILAFPRDANPYQDLLYTAVRDDGHETAYLGELTPSQSFNLLLLPVELLVRRLQGWRVVHLHWVFGFRPFWAKTPRTRRLAQRWFVFVLAVLRALRMTVVWTAHNVLPHEQVFADDNAARRALVGTADLVVAHDASTLQEVARRFGAPCRSVVIPHGPYPLAATTETGVGAGPIRLLFVGKVEGYKGVEDLLTAAAALRPGTFRLRIVGPCADDDLARALRRQAAALGDDVSIELRRLSDTELANELERCDVVVLPFRQVSTSGSLLLALSAGRPVMAPGLPGLVAAGGEALLDYNDLASGLRAAVGSDRAAFARLRPIARRQAARQSWPAAAKALIAAIAASAAGDDDAVLALPTRTDAEGVRSGAT